MNLFGLGLGLSIVIIIVITIVVMAILINLIYRVAKPSLAVVRTGMGGMKVVTSGGLICIPGLHSYKMFDLCMRTIEKKNDVIKTKPAVEVCVSWTAQVTPKTVDTEKIRDADGKIIDTKALSTHESLKKAITFFSDRDGVEIIADVCLTLDGGVREVVATLTPEEVLRDKTSFAAAVKDSVEGELERMGLELISLNIQNVTDPEGSSYYKNLEVETQQKLRIEAENKKAQAEQEIANKRAETNQSIAEKTSETTRIAEQAKLDAELAIAERTRDVEVKKSAMKAEQEQARVKAEYASQLQQQEQEKALAAQIGNVEVEKQAQAKRVAESEGAVAVETQRQLQLKSAQEKEVMVTQAEAQKARLIVNTEAEKEQIRIKAEADKTKKAVDAEAVAIQREKEAEGQANAEVKKAEGESLAIERKANANAKAVELEAEARAKATKLAGEAQAVSTSAVGKAEGDAILAKGTAEAEAEKLLAEARNSNDKVNFEIQKLQIIADRDKFIAIETAKVMAGVGSNAKFITFGDGKDGNGGNNGGMLSTLAQIPRLLEQLNIVNTAITDDGLTVPESLKPYADLLKKDTTLKTDTE